jgi:hypothetical protein
VGCCWTSFFDECGYGNGMVQSARLNQRKINGETMPRNNNDVSSHEIDTGCFGKVPSRLVESISVDYIESLFQEFWQNENPSATDADREHNLKKLDEIRTSVGALYLKLNNNLDNDLKYANAVANNIFSSMLISLFSNKLKPKKYYHLCGPSSQEGYGLMAFRLINVPHEILQRWTSKTSKEYADRVWRTINILSEKEKEYRNVAIATAQIGIGVGGMVLGLAGVVLSLIIPLMFPSAQPPSAKDISNQVVLDLKNQVLVKLSSEKTGTSLTHNNVTAHSTASPAKKKQH